MAGRVAPHHTRNRWRALKNYILKIILTKLNLIIMNIWLHRISHHAEVSYPLLEQGYLSIGFSDFSEKQFLNDILKNGWKNFEDYFNEYWGNTPRTRYNLWRFIVEMKKGDWVIVPSWGTFSIYEIIDDGVLLLSELGINNLQDWSGNSLDFKDNLIYRNEEQIDLGFYRKVKAIKTNIPRNDYADAALTARMKIRQTNANITDLKSNIEAAIKAYEKNEPINIYSKILKQTKETILNTIKKELNPDKFEKLIKWYFEKVGATEVYIPAKNESDKEGDADVVATFDNIKVIIYAQVKFHGGETSDWAIEQIKDYRNNKESMDDGYSKVAWVVTSANKFTNECYEYAKENHVQLIDGSQFATMLIEAGIKNIDKI